MDGEDVCFMTHLHLSRDNTRSWPSEQNIGLSLKTESFQKQLGSLPWNLNLKLQVRFTVHMLKKTLHDGLFQSCGNFLLGCKNDLFICFLTELHFYTHCCTLQHESECLCLTLFYPLVKMVTRQLYCLRNSFEPMVV